MLVSISLTKLMKTRVKFCGLTSVAEAQLVQQHGADAVGVLVGQVHRSADFVEPGLARDIALSVGPFVTPVLVTHLEASDGIRSLADKVPCPVIQLHSDILPSLLGQLRKDLYPRKIIGKVSVEDETAIDRAIAIAPFVDAILLDSVDRTANKVGGTGLIHDWSISAKIVASINVPVILAGGLNPANVCQAIAQVKPWAVDVNSGVETKDGRKSDQLVSHFIQAVRTMP
jgi:phosphoribosylanthranilate isomerase